MRTDAPRKLRTEPTPTLPDRRIFRSPVARTCGRHDGLHQAAAGRHLNVVKVLVARGAPLETRNRWGGTVLDSTVWFALHDRDPGRYIAVLKTLIAGGADVGEVTPFPTGNKQIDDVLRLF